MRFLNKLRDYGYRRAVVLVAIRLIQKVRVFYYKKILSDNFPFMDDVKLNQPAQFVGRGSISFTGVGVGVWPSPRYLTSSAYFEARERSAAISIGEGTFLNNGAIIIADRASVSIGKRCLIGLNFNAMDSDFHGLEIESRSNGRYECKSITIEDDVFIGNDVKILKGVKVLSGAVIGSGALVVSDIPRNAVAVGVPAKVIRFLK